ncbi:thioredoxin domain-containing protein [Streptacidiphilus carbonis]|jgi:protein-disulfide isomerase|uniref:thioredoxin domain-containing protein n=1 Tax=Streptacidiphilus carbonis TaxID=105422 RepID=UPI0005A7B829|nr:thioredoxin domain-containing protein [Streptacidiphilus carbonis]
MSNNSKTSKGSQQRSYAKAGPTSDARARLSAEREREQRVAALRKKILIGVSAVVVVAAAGVAVATSGSGSGSSASSSAPLTVPANTTGSNGTVIVYGKADAPNTLDVYEDFRCPICDELEKADGSTITELADNGTYKIQYHMATFLDSNLGGSGSANALAMAGAAINESPAKFVQLHSVLYANQPEETDDAFAGTDHLLDLARKVPGLVTPAFEKAVKDGTYKPWAQQVSKAFNKSGVTGTPTLKLNGKTLTVFDKDTGKPISATAYQALVQQTIAAAK